MESDDKQEPIVDAPKAEELPFIETKEIELEEPIVNDDINEPIDEKAADSDDEIKAVDD